MITISDSSPLILIAKLNQLNLLKELYSEILIPEEVYRETIVKGKEEGYSDAHKIEMALEDYIFVKKLDQKH